MAEKLMSMQFIIMNGTRNCAWCGKTGIEGKGYSAPQGWVSKSSWTSVKWFCGNKCLSEFNASQGSTDKKSEANNDGFLSRKSKQESETPELIKAKAETEAIKRKEADDDNDRFFDSIKKIFLGKKNKAAKELHSQLEEIEADIRVAISKGDIDEAGKLIRQLKHDSSLFVPKTNTPYSKYWADKREECLNKLN